MAVYDTDIEGPKLDWRVADALQVFVMMANADGVVTSFNKPWHAYTGQPEFDVDADRRWLEYMHPDDRERVMSDWAGAVAAGQRVVDMEYRLREAATGNHRWFRARATALCAADGTIERWVGVAIDVDDEHRAHAKLETLYAGVRAVASSMQRASLPSELPSARGVEFAALYLPSVRTMTIGGDWYDAFELDDGSLAISIGDVQGHGVEAAVLMGKIRYSLRTIALRAATLHSGGPASMLRSAEAALLSEHREAMATAFFAIVDPARTTITYASAGHPPPLFLSRDGGSAWAELGDPPLGCRLGDFPRRDHAMPLRDVARTIFYTDGLIEAERDIVRDLDVLRQTAERLRDRSLTHVPEALVERLHASVANDDVAVLVVDFAGTGADRSAGDR
ncbi:MAG TPA: SpoIIE family protein phosphatase [Candidatus Baltobacteraceae bacterium]|nr:SpoIIE family protein phosphatase [Candidatus Baltobacteraceae bacterium]